MAYISVVNKTAGTVTLKVADLQPEWARGDRTINWYIGTTTPSESSYDKKQSLILDDTLSSDKTSGGEVIFSRLSPGTLYYILCTIYFEDECLRELTGQVWTDAEDDTTVDLITYNLGVVDSDYVTGFYIEPYELLMYPVRFNRSGTAKFYSSGYPNCRCYLSISTEWDDGTGKPTDYLKQNFDGGGSYDDDYDFLISYNVVAGTQYYVWIRGQVIVRSYSGNLHIDPPEQGSTDTWTWSNAAYNAFLNNGKTTDVSYAEWNEFVDFVYQKTWSTLSGALMDSSDKTLYAEKFNIVRRAIGGVNSFQVGTNSIRDHYNSTGSWDMKKGETVKGEYFIDLTEYVNEIE